MAAPLMSIVRCNLLITYKGLNELAGRSWFDKYTMQCPALYTTSLISQIPPTFYTQKRVPYVLNFSEGDGLLAQDFIINFSYGDGLNYYLNYGLLIDFSVGNGLAAVSVNANTIITDFVIGNGMNANSAGTDTTSSITNYSIGNGLPAASTGTVTTTFTISG